MPAYFSVLAAASGERTPLNLPVDAPRQLDSASGSGSLVRTLVGLAIVVAVIYGVAWVLRQAKKAKTPSSLGDGLATEAVIALGPNRALHLVRVGQELVLLGVSEHSITPIRSYSRQEARAAGLLDAPELPSSTGLAIPAPPVGTVLERLRARTAR